MEIISLDPHDNLITKMKKEGGFIIIIIVVRTQHEIYPLNKF